MSYSHISYNAAMSEPFILDRNILLEGGDIAEPGTFTVQVDRQVEINVLPEEARRRVNQFVHLELSTQLHAEMPLLVLGREETVAWRVPIHLTLPAYGDVGSVGFIEVDPVSGEINSSAATIAAIETHAAALARRFTSTAANAG